MLYASEINSSSDDTITLFLQRDEDDTMTTGFPGGGSGGEFQSPEPLQEIIDSSPHIDPIAAIVVPIVFFLIFVFGIIGNSLQVATVVLNSSMRRSPPNVLIAGLGVGDLLLLIVSVPFAATVYTLPGWSFGTPVCKLSTAAYSVSLGVSVLTLTALSADRYVAIVRPLTAMRVSTLRRSLVVTAGVWTTAVALGGVDVFAAEVRVRDGGIEVCDPYPPEWGDWYEQFLPTFRFGSMFVGPLIAIGVFYVCIARVLMAGCPFEASLDTSAVVAALLGRQDRERRRVAKVVLSFVVVFVVCWLPRHVYLMVYYWSDLEFNVYWHIFKIFGFCLTFIYSCVNPLALYLFSDDFRRYFDHYLFGCCIPSRRHRSYRRRDTTLAYQTTILTHDVTNRSGGQGQRVSRGSLGSAVHLPTVSIENININVLAAVDRQPRDDGQDT